MCSAELCSIWPPTPEHLEATCDHKNCADYGPLLYGSWKPHIPRSPEEWTGIRASAAEQLESVMCPEEWRRLWEATAEQLESDLWPPAWRRLWAAACVFLLQPCVFGRVNLWPRLCSTLMAKRTATLLDVADEREGESAGLGDERGCCSDWLGRSDMREMLP